jgi:hypothetical protein
LQAIKHFPVFRWVLFDELFSGAGEQKLAQWEITTEGWAQECPAALSPGAGTRIGGCVEQCKESPEVQ